MSAGPSTATGPSFLGMRVVIDPNMPADTFAIVTPATFAGSHLSPPPPLPPVAISADPDRLPDAPTEAEQSALRDLPIDARYALCACRGPGWTVYAAGVAVPRLRAVSPALVGVAVAGWLPAGLCEIVDLIAVCMGIGRRSTMQMITAEVNEDTPLRVTALRILSRVWR